MFTGGWQDLGSIGGYVEGMIIRQAPDIIATKLAAPSTDDLTAEIAEEEAWPAEGL